MHNKTLQSLSMTQSLVSVWRNDPGFLEPKTIAQIVGIAGDGVLKDGNKTSDELREFLSEAPASKLEQYANECLSTKFDNGPFALQDVVNEIGARLDFEVTPGRYKGVRNQVGNDGLWRSKGDSHTDAYDLVMELKTTDAYAIDLNTIAKYRDSLISDGTCKEDQSSILLVVGRNDTGGLEAQIRGSRHAWDIRLISVDALIQLMHIKQQMNDWATSTQINKLLRPMEFTRLDHIVDLLFHTARDSEEDQVVDSDEPAIEATKKANGSYGPSGFDHDAARDRALNLAATQIDCVLKKKGRVFWTGRDGEVRAVCLSSQPYDDTSGNGYWYGFTPGHQDFLEEAGEGYLLLACGLVDPPLLFRWADFKPILQGLKATYKKDQPDQVFHWHITVNHGGSRAEMNVPLQGGRKDVSRFLL